MAFSNQTRKDFTRQTSHSLLPSSFASNEAWFSKFSYCVPDLNRSGEVSMVSIGGYTSKISGDTGGVGVLYARVRKYANQLVTQS